MGVLLEGLAGLRCTPLLLPDVRSAHDQDGGAVVVCDAGLQMEAAVHQLLSMTSAPELLIASKTFNGRCGASEYRFSGSRRQWTATRLYPHLADIDAVLMQLSFFAKHPVYELYVRSRDSNEMSA